MMLFSQDYPLQLLQLVIFNYKKSDQHGDCLSLLPSLIHFDKIKTNTWKKCETFMIKF